MAFDTGDIAGLIGLGIVGAVAIKTVDTLGNVIQNTTQPQPQSRKKKSKKSNNVFAMENVKSGHDNFYNIYDDKPKKGKKTNQNTDNFFSGISF